MSAINNQPNLQTNSVRLFAYGVLVILALVMAGLIGYGLGVLSDEDVSLESTNNTVNDVEDAEKVFEKQQQLITDDFESDTKAKLIDKEEGELGEYRRYEFVDDFHTVVVEFNPVDNREADANWEAVVSQEGQIDITTTNLAEEFCSDAQIEQSTPNCLEDINEMEIRVSLETLNEESVLIRYDGMKVGEAGGENIDYLESFIESLQLK